MNIRTGNYITHILNKNFKKGAKVSDKVGSMVSELSNPGNLLPVILLEGAVIAGRTYQANERGGWIESRERFTEEILTAIVWLGGVKAFNKLFDHFLKKDFIKKKIGDIGIDVGSDAIRNPAKKVSKLFAFTKFGKIAASSAAAIFLVGSVIPNINQKITKDYIDSAKQGKRNPKPEKDRFLHPKIKASLNRSKVSMEDFLKQCNDKALSFKGGLASSLKYIAHSLENKPLWGVLSVDTGVISGRSIHARNQDERNEIIFRDLGSMFFYMATTPLTIKLMQKWFDKEKITTVDPKVAKEINTHIKDIIKNDPNISVDDLGKKILGNKNKSKGEFFIDRVKSYLHNYENKAIKIKDMRKILEEVPIISRSQHKEQIINGAIEKAKDIAKHLQPQNPGVIAYNQLDDVLLASGDGLIHKPEIVKNLLNIATKGVSDDKNKFISQKKLDGIRQTIKDYSHGVIKELGYVEKSDGSFKIEANMIDNIAHKSTLKKLGFFGLGFGISALFLSTIIPKVQYYITQQRTGENKFPGVKDLQDMK